VSVTLRNTSGEPLYLGSPDGRRVEPDEVVRIDGALAKEQPDDAVVIGEGDDARAYPSSLWSQVATGKAPANTEEK
jgi:hypothetical protein